VGWAHALPVGPPPPPPPPPGGTTLTFTPVADTYAKGDQPGSTFGTSISLTDGSPDLVIYLRFNPSGVGSPITKATLRVFASSANSIGYQARGVTDITWSETTLNYANKPLAGPVVDPPDGSPPAPGPKST
jgi:hypothetical protein